MQLCTVIYGASQKVPQVTVFPPPHPNPTDILRLLRGEEGEGDQDPLWSRSSGKRLPVSPLDSMPPSSSTVFRMEWGKGGEGAPSEVCPDCAGG